jgi:hypothetical protein
MALLKCFLNDEIEKVLSVVTLVGVYVVRVRLNSEVCSSVLSCVKSLLAGGSVVDRSLVVLLGVSVAMGFVVAGAVCRLGVLAFSLSGCGVFSSLFLFRFCFFVSGVDAGDRHAYLFS